MAETTIQFLERWRQAHVYAELRALEQLDETVAECIGAAAEDDISADELEKAAGGSPSHRNCQYERIVPMEGHIQYHRHVGHLTC